MYWYANGQESWRVETAFEQTLSLMTRKLLDSANLLKRCSSSQHTHIYKHTIVYIYIHNW